MGGAAVELSSTGGTLGAVTDNSDGTYTANLTTDQDLTAITVSGKVNGTDISSSARIAVKVSPNTSTSALAVLGEKIFSDTNLSNPIGSQSCATCHDVTSGTFVDVRPSNATSEGAEAGRFGGRNTQTTSYAAHTPDQFRIRGVGKKIGGQFWDGRADSLEEQARLPFLDTVEMGNPDKTTVISKIKAATYANDFESVFGAGALNDVETAFVQMSEAIAAFERTRVFSPFTSKWDAENADGEIDGDVFNDSELRGFAVFKQGACDTCHLTPDDLLGAQVFTNFDYENIGVPKNPTNPLLQADANFRDFGAGSAPIDAEDGPHSNLNADGTAAANGVGLFKVPTLRNIANTAPYMHNGVFTTLEQVIDFYNSDLVSVPGVDLTTAEVGNTVTDQYFNVQFFSNQQEKDDLKAFLEALSDGFTP